MRRAQHAQAARAARTRLQQEAAEEEEKDAVREQRAHEPCTAQTDTCEHPAHLIWLSVSSCWLDVSRYGFTCASRAREARRSRRQRMHEHTNLNREHKERERK